MVRLGPAQQPVRSTGSAMRQSHQLRRNPYPPTMVGHERMTNVSWLSLFELFGQPLEFSGHLVEQFAVQKARHLLLETAI